MTLEGDPSCTQTLLLKHPTIVLLLAHAFAANFDNRHWCVLSKCYGISAMAHAGGCSVKYNRKENLATACSMELMNTLKVRGSMAVI